MSSRKFTDSMKKKILTSYWKAKESGKRGAIKAVLTKYGITGVYIHHWLKTTDTVKIVEE